MSDPLDSEASRAAAPLPETPAPASDPNTPDPNVPDPASNTATPGTAVDATDTGHPAAAASATAPTDPHRPAIISRRALLGVGGMMVAGGTAFALPRGTTHAARPVTVMGAAMRRSVASTATPNPVPGGSLDPLSIPKYVTELGRLPVMPRAGSATFNGAPVDTYAIASRRFTQQLLPSGYPRSTVFGYGAAFSSGTFHTPGYTIEARYDRPVRVTWINQLVDGSGKYVPHLFTVDPTLHWTNPPAGVSGRDSHSTFTSTPPPYTGPVPLVTHLHGAHVTEESDGYPEAWTLPNAANIPSGYATVGTFYDQYKAEAAARYGVAWQPGSSIYQYRNDQRATALWYHDHALGMTRVNVQSGLAGMYLLRGGPSDLPPGVLPYGQQEVAMVLQDRSFNTDGSIFFPDSRTFFGDTTPGGPWIPTTDTPPYWNPEFFANTIVVNGSVWPVWHVNRLRYRLRVLNSSNARTYLLKLVTNPLANRPANAALPIWQIGADGGFLPAPVQLAETIVAPAERADLILDFTGVPAGTVLYLINEGPDEPYHGGVPNTDFVAADPYTSGQIMKIVVGGPPQSDPSIPPSQLHLPSIARPGAPTQTFGVSLIETDSTAYPGAPIYSTLGTLNPDGTGNVRFWDDPVDVNPVAGNVTEWDLVNFTVDGHPIHIHQTQFQVISRTAADGTVRGPQPWETGTKDTVIALPGETTKVRAFFDIPGRYVYHCHIIDHEDNEMMRPFIVQP
jgi:spore coat protein A